MEADKKLKVLCLHGYLQNAEVFRKRTGALRKALRSRCEFTFVDAPHEVAWDVSDEERAACGADGGGARRGWWLPVEHTRPSLSREYTGWSTSLEVLRQAAEREGPFDIVLGFSQGATAAALLCCMLEKIQPSQPSLRLAIIISGFVPRDESYAVHLHTAKPMQIPALHVFGTTDQLVIPERAKELLACWSPKNERHETLWVWEHPGGHGIPSGASFREKVREVVDAAAAREAASVGAPASM